MTTPTVSVLMPTYDYGRFLERAVESVLAQSYRDLELVVSDNASTDETEALMRAYAARDPRVRYHRNPENVGLAANFTLAFERSDPGSRYLITLPADDWWEPTLLEELVAAAEAEPEAAVVHSDIFRTDAEGAVLNTYNDMIGHDRPDEGLHRDVGRLLRVNYIPIQTALIRRATVRALCSQGQPFDPELPNVNDYHLWLTLFTQGAAGYYLDRPLGYYRKHEQAQTMPANLTRRLEQEARCFEKIADDCPPELRADCRAALAQRRATLGFHLLSLARADQARRVLRTSWIGPRRLDRSVATLISHLPLPARQRGMLWNWLTGLMAPRERSA